MARPATAQEPITIFLSARKNSTKTHYNTQVFDIDDFYRTSYTLQLIMNTAQAGLENADLERLNDKDKADLRQFLANEEQRAMIQSRTSLPETPNK